MAMVISTNTASINAQRHLNSSRQDLDVAMERLSSGQRINSAADDAAGLAIRDKMTSQIEGLNQAVRNANDAISFMQTAEGALEETTSILQRMRTLAVQSVNDTNTSADRTNLNDELEKLQEEITRIGNNSTFNNKLLINGDMAATADQATFQIGHNAEQTIQITLNDMRSEAIGDKAAVSTTAATYASTAVTFTQVTAPADLDTISVTIDGQTFTTGNLIASADSTATKIGDAFTARSDAYTGWTISNAAGVVTFSKNADYVGGTTGGGSSDNGQTAIITEATPTATTAGTGTGSWTTTASDSAAGSAAVSTQAATVTLSNIVLTSMDEATKAINTIDQALLEVGQERSKLGAFQNRLQFAVNNMTNMSANTSAARSLIADADYAAESSSLAKNQILQQAGTAMLAQANAQAQSVLSLLK
jgi:flagellin